MVSLHIYVGDCHMADFVEYQGFQTHDGLKIVFGVFLLVFLRSLWVKSGKTSKMSVFGPNNGVFPIFKNSPEYQVFYRNRA